MFKLITVALAAGGAAAAGLVALIARRPDSFSVERTEHIAAPPAKVYDLVSDFREWRRWSPWETMDPDMSRSYRGAERGIGAIYEWDGNRKAGRGKLEIVDAQRPSRLSMDLHFIKPFKSENVTQFEFSETDGGTVVTWSMRGPATFATKLMSTFMSLEKMIGSDYEKGLANLKALAEGND